MASFVLLQIDAAIDLFTSLIQHGANAPRYHRNLQWLRKLRARASFKISTAQTNDMQRDPFPNHRRSTEDREESEDLELLGWRTRLIQRADQDRPTIRTIPMVATPTRSQMTNDPANRNIVENTEPMLSNTTLPMVTPNQTDDLVRSRIILPKIKSDMHGLAT